MNQFFLHLNTHSNMNCTGDLIYCMWKSGVCVQLFVHYFSEMSFRTCLNLLLLCYFFVHKSLFNWYWCEITTAFCLVLFYLSHFFFQLLYFLSPFLLDLLYEFIYIHIYKYILYIFINWSSEWKKLIRWYITYSRLESKSLYEL